jgi:hypothetical protein
MDTYSQSLAGAENEEGLDGRISIPTLSAPQPSSTEFPDVNLRKPQSGLPPWAWLLIVLALLGPVLLVCGGLVAAFLASQYVPPAPAPMTLPTKSGRS